MTLTELSTALAARGLIAEDPLAIAPGPEGSTSPWFVQAMMGACAWVAGLLLMAFVALLINETQHQDNWGLLLFLGLAACAGAAILYAKRNSFSEQFALAVSCGGQFAIAVSIGQLSTVRVSLWAMVLVEIVLVFTMRHRLHRILSSFGAVLAWALAVPGVNRTESYQIPLQVLLWLVVWAPVVCGAYWLATHEARWMAEGRDGLLRPVTYGLIASIAIVPMAPSGGLWAELFGASPERIALWPLLAMFLALFALVLAFRLRNRPLMGVAIVFALAEVSASYYVLGTTLLVKSVIMLVMGAVLLASAQWLAKEAK